MPRVGLVLGAGGVVGQAYQAGVLWALHEQAGWDARTADVIVGTSAGSVTGTLLRLGVAPGDLAARELGRPVSNEGAAVFDRLLPRSLAFPPMRPATCSGPGERPPRRWSPGRPGGPGPSGPRLRP